ncbi:MAG: glucose dehydrogenase [Chloroflexota bacterium]
MRWRASAGALASLALATGGARGGTGPHFGYGLVRVASGLDRPVYVAGAPGERGRLYVVEQEGAIRVLERGHARLFLDIRDRVGSKASEQGLLSVAFPPSYPRSRRFYVDYTDLRGDTRVVEFRSDGQRGLPRTARELLFVDQPYANHNGGQLQFGPEGKLYVGMGDGGSAGDPGNQAQNLSSRLGKLLRADPLKPAWEIAGYGLRNPWRFSFDRQTGALYIADVGQDAWEEVDFRPLGAPPANYGWARYEGRHLFKDIPLAGHAPLVFPIAEYGHSQGCSVTGGYVYRGKAVRAARGRYFFGDYCSGTIWSLRVEQGRARDLRREPFRVESLSSFGEDAAGELYLVSHQGQIYRLAARPGP